ncbi:MAG: hypothetical protein AAF657_00685 [Acidobacteriota bacterium]
MRSRAAFVRIQSVEEVRASLESYGVGIADRLEGRRAAPAPGEGESVAIYQALFDDLDRDLAGIHSRLVEAEDAHVRKRIQVSQHRRTGEELTEDLYDRQVAVRRTLAGLYGPDRGFELAAFSGETPRSAPGLVDQVDQTVKLLRAPEADVPELAVGGVDVNLGNMAGRLEAGMEQIRQVRGRFNRARKAAGESLILRNKAIEEFDQVFPWVARTLESLFRLAGETELANRIRSSVRQLTRRPVDEEEEQTAEASAEGSETEATEQEPTEPAEPVSDAPSSSGP